ncbi:EIF2AK3 [Symbiodinium natans]|uniref:non-specific serine/threonine protein kinase n=1 Tax=Symbiodinium natans TaxID=878477 RepID=A0A812SQJ0_9DINO|nr:EIF2AK3 [Symbiodinium natans]
MLPHARGSARHEVLRQALITLRRQVLPHSLPDLRSTSEMKFLHLHQHRHKWVQDLKARASQAAGIFHQVASALAELHRVGLAHRDLKPSNILFGLDGGENDDNLPCGGVRLCDFGLAKLMEESGDRATFHSPGVGTRVYASPEQRELGSYGLKTDIFSLGIILAEMLCPARAPRALRCTRRNGASNPP